MHDARPKQSTKSRNETCKLQNADAFIEQSTSFPELLRDEVRGKIIVEQFHAIFYTTLRECL